jgi:hypothetical protein
MSGELGTPTRHLYGMTVDGLLQFSLTSVMKVLVLSECTVDFGNNCGYTFKG